MRPPYWDRKQPFRGRLGVVLALALIVAIALLASLFQPPAATLAGQAEAVDGDTLRFGPTRVRLVGLDAPELDQTCIDANGDEWTCGTKAKVFVAALVRGGATTCVASGRDRYGRVLAKCTVSNLDVGDAIVAAGWAVADFDYAVTEAAARIARRGIWAGRFERPADWRRDHGNEAPGLWEWIRAWFH